MTTLYEETAKCVVCGAKSKYMVIGSTNTFGSPDLDTRPPEMQRSTMFAWVQRCPKCGYCASDISEDSEVAQDVVTGGGYLSQLNDPAFPKLANEFLCKALVDQAKQDYGSATWSMIHAAWVCDDSEHADQAMICRRKAVEMLRITEKSGPYEADEDAVRTAVLIDLLRRSERIDEARQELSGRRDRVVGATITRILDFQLNLLDRSDISCHTIDEAVEEDE